MQLCAQDGDKSITALQAVKGKDYRCPQCQERLRLRGGRLQQLHFYHPNPKVSCANAKKSAIHLQTQLRLKRSFPDAQLEHYFPEINRFADVVVPSKKLIFEVQCSPISLFEVRSRQAAYAKTGYHLIWILHEKNFNQRVLSESELYLRESPSYFTNITGQGTGMIYDQFELIQDVKRFYIAKKCPVSFSQYYHIKKDTFKNLPKNLITRIEKWPLFFQNDLLFRIWRNPQLADSLQQLEKAKMWWWKSLKWRKLYRRFIKYYQFKFRLALLRYAK